MLLAQGEECQVGFPNAIHCVWGPGPGTASPVIGRCVTTEVRKNRMNPVFSPAFGRNQERLSL
jgi:hypothetical protein